MRLLDYELLDLPDGTFVYLHQYSDEKYLIALNFTNESKTISLPFAGNIILSTEIDRQGAVDNSLTVYGDEGILIRLI